MLMVERDPTKKGASGKMSYYTRVAVQSRTHAQVLAQAMEYQSASSLAAAKRSKKEMVFVTVSWSVYHTLMWLECQ